MFSVADSSDDTLKVLNGIRVLSIAWVICGHAFNFYLISPISNILSMNLLKEKKLISLIFGGTFSVDSFFFLSGFLTFYLVTAKMYAKKGSENYLLLYFHRYYRLIFPLLFVMGFCTSLIKYFGDGPVYYQTWDMLNEPCKKYWWSNILFINNLYPWRMSKECMGWVWYLANDFQFFLLTPPLLTVYCKNRHIGYALICLLLLGNIITNGVLGAIYKVGLSGDSTKGNMEDLMYSKPWSRIGAYLVGGIFGLSYLELKFKDKYPQMKASFFNKFYEILQNSTMFSVIIFLVGVGITAMYVFQTQPYISECNQGNCWNIGLTTIYVMTQRPGFVFGLGLILSPMLVNRLSMIKFILRSDLFTIMARLTYTVYLIHVVIMCCVLFDTRQSYYVDQLNGWWFGFGSFLLSYLIAIPVCLLCEVPFMNIEKYILFPTKPKQAQVKQLKNEDPELEMQKPLMKRVTDVEDNSEEQTHQSINNHK